MKGKKLILRPWYVISEYQLRPDSEITNGQNYFNNAKGGYVQAEVGKKHRNNDLRPLISEIIDYNL